MNVDPLELAAQQLQAQVTELSNALYQRADPVAKAALLALEVWCQLAEQPPSPIQQAARQQIVSYVAVFDRMRAITAGIHVVREIPGGSNGRTERPDAG